MTLAQQLHSLRIDRGLSINALATQSGVGRNKVTRMELGAEPSISDLRALLAVLEPNAKKRASIWRTLDRPSHV